MERMLDNFILPLPDGLHNTNVDNILADSLPLLTMLACVPVLRLFVRQKNHTNLVKAHLLPMAPIWVLCLMHSLEGPCISPGCKRL